MKAHRVGTQGFHFLEIADHRVPLLLPVIFQETIGGVVVVIEAPRCEPQPGVGKYKALSVFIDPDEFAFAALHRHFSKSGKSNEPDGGQPTVSHHDREFVGRNSGGKEQTTLEFTLASTNPQSRGASFGRSSRLAGAANRCIK